MCKSLGYISYDPVEITKTRTDYMKNKLDQLTGWRKYEGTDNEQIFEIDSSHLIPKNKVDVDLRICEGVQCWL